MLGGVVGAGNGNYYPAQRAIVHNPAIRSIISAISECGVAKSNRNDPASPSPNADPSTTVT